jgi:hypothetical protein
MDENITVHNNSSRTVRAEYSSHNKLKIDNLLPSATADFFSFVSIPQRDESLKICCSQSSSRQHVLTKLIKSVLVGGSTCVSRNKIYYKGMNPSKFVAASQARISTY